MTKHIIKLKYHILKKEKILSNYTSNPVTTSKMNEKKYRTTKAKVTSAMDCILFDFFNEKRKMLLSARTLLLKTREL